MNLKEIPGTQGFLADELGNIYGPDLIKRDTYKNGDGYITASVKLTDGRWVTFGVQRLEALAHLSDKRPVDCNYVNHRDCDIENNRKDNLEWVTSSQNNIHSEIMRRDNQYITIIAERNGSPFGMYKNAHEAAFDLNINALSVWDSIKDSKAINEHGVIFKHRPYSGKIPTSLRKRTDPNKDKRGIKTLDIDTGDIVIFESFHIAAKRFETSASHLYQSISRNEHVRLFRKKYQVAYVEDDFPEISTEDLVEAKGHGPKEVIAYDVCEQIFIIFSSAKEYYKTFGLSKTAVTRTLRHNVIREIDSKIALYLNPENVAKLLNHVKGPANT